MSRGPTMMHSFKVTRDNSIISNRESQLSDDIFYIQIQVQSAFETSDSSSSDCETSDSSSSDCETNDPPDDDETILLGCPNINEKSFTVGRKDFLTDDNAEILMSEKLSSMGVPVLDQLGMIHQVRCLSRRMNEEDRDSSGSTVLPILLTIRLLTSVERSDGYDGDDDDDDDDDDEEEDDESDDEELSRAVVDSMIDTFVLRPATESSIEGLEKIKRVESLAIKEECMICLEEIRVGLEVARMPCSHVYHSECIVQWLETSHVCPLCRFQMPRREEH